MRATAKSRAPSPWSLLSVKTISVADAKANFSSVLNGVEQKKTPVTILRRGVPVAQIVPLAAPPIRLWLTARCAVQFRSSATSSVPPESSGQHGDE